MFFASLLSFLKIILVDIVMSGDNAVVIAMATKNLPKKVKKKAIYGWTAGAAILRIGLALLSVYLLQYPIIKFIWWILLLYIAWGFFKQLKLGQKEKKIKTHTSLRWAIGVIVLADLSLSLDNVLAVATMANNMRVLSAWLIISIALIIFAANALSRLMKKHERIMRTGLLVILHASIEIIFGAEIKIPWLPIPLVWIVLILALIIISYLYIHHITHVEFHVRRHHIHNYTRFAIISVSFLLLVLNSFVPSIQQLLTHYLSFRITLLVVSYMVFLELIMQQRAIDHHKMLHQMRH